MVWELIVAVANVIIYNVLLRTISLEIARRH